MSGRGADAATLFAAFYRAHYGAVLAYARRRAGEEAARDVAAQTFEVAWRRREVAFERGLPWLYATARLVMGHQARSTRRARATLERLGHQRAPAAVDHAEEHAARDALRRALEVVSEADREVLGLIAWEQLEVSEAAEVMGCSSATAHVRLHRARRRLRVALERARTSNPQEER